MVTVIVDSSLRVPIAELPPSAEEEIKRTLTVWNKARADAVERGEYGAEDEPEWIDLWSYDVGNRHLVLPRGFKLPLERGLAGLGEQVRWIDRTSRVPVDFWTSVRMASPTLRPDQDRLVREIMSHGGGILVARTGSGKTIMGLEMWRRLGLRGIVLVEKGHLVRQWQERSRQHLGYEPGLIGDGQWEERDLTIAMLQTLYRRLDDLPDEWFASWGFVDGDEIHHAVAPTYRKVFRRFSPAFLLGKTATALEGDWRQPILTSLVGPIVARSERSELEPTIVPVHTEFDWQPRESIRNGGQYYQKLQVEIAKDGARNWLIAHKILEQPKACAQLVLSRRLAHLRMLKEAIEHVGYPRDQIYMLRGSESLDEREAVQARIEDGSCVVLSTVAGEGFDAPRLDRLHLAWPSKSRIAIVQSIGRVLRPHDDKLDPVVFDYVDHRNNLLRKQWMERLHGTYVPSGWTVEQPRRAS